MFIYFPYTKRIPNVYLKFTKYLFPVFYRNGIFASITNFLQPFFDCARNRKSVENEGGFAVFDNFHYFCEVLKMGNVRLSIINY